jgi:hypothetical protein
MFKSWRHLHQLSASSVSIAIGIPHCCENIKMASFFSRTTFRTLNTLFKATPCSKTPITAPLAQPLARRFIGTLPREQPRLRLGSTGQILASYCIDCAC